MDELYEIRVDFDKDEYIKNELEITEQSVIELKEYLSESNYEVISLKSCSILQLSSYAVSSSTPRAIRALAITWWRS